MAKNQDEFDVLTFFIIVMIVLTAIVGIFAYLLYNRVNDQSKAIGKELKKLEQLEQLGANEDFRTWIQRERDSKTAQLPPSEFTARIVQSSKTFRVNVDGINPQPLITRRSFEELPFNITVKSVRLEPLIRFLFDVEEKWIGAKVKQMQLTWIEKKKSWSAEATISIFKTTPSS